MSEAPEIVAEPNGEPSDQYAVVEIFGHRKLAGRVIEVEQFGTKLLRVDVPKDGKFDNGFTTQLYGGASIFSFTPCDLAVVEKLNAPSPGYSRLTFDPRREHDPDVEIPF